MTNIDAILASGVIGTWPNGITTDETKERNKLEHNKMLGDSNALNPVGLKEFNYSWKDSKLLLVPLFDIHAGGEGFEAQRFKMVLDFIHNCRIARTFFGGDMFDNANLLGKTLSLVARQNPSQQFDYLTSMEEMQNCIKDNKVLFAIYGNHDGETNDRTKQANISLVKNFCNLNNIPCAEYNALLNLQWIGQDLASNIFVTHGSSKTMDPAVACDQENIKMINAMMTAGKNPEIVDAVYFGHLHIDGYFPKTIKVNCYDEQGKTLPDKTKTLNIMCEPPMQGLNDFAARSNMKAFGTNAYATELSLVQNPRYKANKDGEYPYVLKVNRFPILDKQKNCYTTFANDYLENKYYREPHELKAELEEKYYKENNSIIKDFPYLVEGI